MCHINMYTEKFLCTYYFKRIKYNNIVIFFREFDFQLADRLIFHILFILYCIIYKKKKVNNILTYTI